MMVVVPAERDRPGPGHGQGNGQMGKGAGKQNQPQAEPVVVDGKKARRRAGKGPWKGSITYHL